jgi:predicted RNA polymerase sigma factor
MIALDPKYPVSYWSRADLMRDLERHTEAVAAYTRALELESNVAGKFSRRVRMPEIRAYVEGLPQTAQTQALLALVAAKSN